MPIPEFTEMDEPSQYLAEWDKAQQRYQAGINAGYSDADAQQMYLAPVQAKWSVMEKIPDSMKPQAANELDAAHLSFLNGIQAGYKPQQSADLYLLPKLDKWRGVSQFAHESDPLLREKDAALRELQDGIYSQEVINNHPQKIFADPRFEARFETYAHEAERERMNAAKNADIAKSKAAAKDTPDAAWEKLFKFNTGATKYKAENPDSAALPAMADERGQLENATTNGPSIVHDPSRWNPQPPADTGPTNEDLVQQQHPDWTPAQVKLGVSGRLGGAITTPDIGEVRKGYRFKGGNPADKSNWEPVSQ